MNDFHGSHDWNGNGEIDPFDLYVDYHIIDSAENASDKSSKQPTAPQKSSGGFLKGLLTIGLCLGGFLVPAATGMGGFGAIISILVAVFLAAALWSD